MQHRRIESFLRQLVILGIAAVVLIPAARGSSLWIGWLPLWLVGMPLAAWLSLLRLPKPQIAWALPRRRRPQARRQRVRRVGHPAAFSTPRLSHGRGIPGLRPTFRTSAVPPLRASVHGLTPLPRSPPCPNSPAPA